MFAVRDVRFPIQHLLCIFLRQGFGLRLKSWLTTVLLLKSAVKGKHLYSYAAAAITPQQTFDFLFRSASLRKKWPIYCIFLFYLSLKSPNLSMNSLFLSFSLCSSRSEFNKFVVPRELSPREFERKIYLYFLLYNKASVTSDKRMVGTPVVEHGKQRWRTVNGTRTIERTFYQRFWFQRR